MATFVLVGGAWLGAWAWDAVTARLRRDGHTVYPVTLTGLGERQAEATPEVGLERHVADIVAVIEENDLRDVMLVAHSYGGMPVTGAADRVRDRLAAVIYVDSGPALDGAAHLDFYGEGQAGLKQTVAEQGQGWLLPVPSWDVLETVFGASIAGISPEQREAAQARMTPQPFATYTEPLRLTNPPDETLPKIAILNSFPEAVMRDMIESGHPMGAAMQGPEWSFVELPTGHWPMFSRPDDLAVSLDKIATGTKC